MRNHKHDSFFLHVYCVSFNILSTASFKYSELCFSKNYNNYEIVKVLRPYYIAVQTSDYKFFEKTMHILKLRPVLTSKIKSIKELGQVLKKHS